MYILGFQYDVVDPKYYVGVVILTIVGFMFVVMLGMAMCYGGFGDNFALLFEDLGDHPEQRRAHNAMDSNFYDAFDKIHTVIYEPYLTLKNKTCPICLVEYRK